MGGGGLGLGAHDSDLEGRNTWERKHYNGINSGEIANNEENGNSLMGCF